MSIGEEEIDLAGVLRAQARRQPDKVALIAPERRGGWRETCFAALDGMSDRYAHGFAAAGLRAGDRTVFLARPTIETLAAIYALVRMRAVPVAIDPGMGFGELLRCIREIRPDCLIGVPMLHLLRRLVPGPFRGARLFITDGAVKLPGTRTLASCLSETHTPYEAEITQGTESGFIFFTSGSTGTAKPVAISNANLAHRLRLVASVCGWDEEARVVACFPSYAPAVLAVGGTAILPPMDFARPGSALPARIVSAIREKDANGVLAAPVVWMNLVRHCEKTGERLESIRDGITAGAPIPVNLHRRLADLLHPQGTLHTPYGATEALPLTAVTSQMLIETWEDTRAGRGVCVGPVLPEMRLEVIGITDDPLPVWSEDLRVAPDEIGELVAGGPTVSGHYPCLPEADAAAKIRDGEKVLHRMGDLGRIDEQGRLWFCGRKADRIERDGALLLPVCVEAMLAEHPAIFQAAAVEIEANSRLIIMCLRLERGVRLDEKIVAELEALISGSSWQGRIDYYLQRIRIPTDTRHNSKIRRGDLARMARAELHRAFVPAR